MQKKRDKNKRNSIKYAITFQACYSKYSWYISTIVTMCCCNVNQTSEEHETLTLHGFRDHLQQQTVALSVDPLLVQLECKITVRATHDLRRVLATVVSLQDKTPCFIHIMNYISK